MKTQSERESIISLRNVAVTYAGSVAALRATTTNFYRGEIAVLLGLSGAGKSTLLRTLNHLVLPTEGEVISAELGALSRNASVLRSHRQRTAVVFQQHQLIERLGALDNVLMGRLGYHSTWRTLLPLPKPDIELALHCLERVGLAEKAMTRIDQLSGGQQQRVGIARALAQQPVMILADEPVASLDPATAGKVLELLRTICTEDRITAVISLHQLDLALRFADRIVGLHDGSIVFDSNPADLGKVQIARIYGHLDGDSPPRIPTRPNSDPVGEMILHPLEVAT